MDINCNVEEVRKICHFTTLMSESALIEMYEHQKWFCAMNMKLITKFNKEFFSYRLGGEWVPYKKNPWVLKSTMEPCCPPDEFVIPNGDWVGNVSTFNFLS